MFTDGQEAVTGVYLGGSDGYGSFCVFDLYAWMRCRLFFQCFPILYIDLVHVTILSSVFPTLINVHFSLPQPTACPVYRSEV